MPYLKFWHAGVIVLVVSLFMLLLLYIMPEPEYLMASECHCAPFAQIALCIINETHRDCACVPLGTYASEGEKICLEEARIRQEDQKISKLGG